MTGTCNSWKILMYWRRKAKHQDALGDDVGVPRGVYEMERG